MNAGTWFLVLVAGLLIAADGIGIVYLLIIALSGTSAARDE